MSRFTEIVSRIKKDLNQYNVKNININEIKWAINQSQQNFIFQHNLIEKEITIPIVSGTRVYPLVYHVGGTGSGEGEDLPIIKKIKSIKFPDTWVNIQWRTSKQFDAEVSEMPDITYPLIVTVRGQNLELWGAPTDINAEIVYWAYLRKQTQDADENYEPEIDSIFDEAVRYYADYLLMPLDHPLRLQMKQEGEAEAEQYTNITNTDSYSRSPIPNW
jgi:hypothetical protein